MDCEVSQPRADEDPETKNLDKAELYEDVAEDWFLPPLHSRGMTREHLLDVRSGKVFRVSLITLKKFEVDLTTKMTKKVGAVNSGLLVRKLNILLISRGQNPLGIDEYDPSEQVV